MNVKDLIEQLQKLPPDYEVFYEGGDYKDDWREVRQVEIARRSTEVSWGYTGVFLS